MLTTSCTKLTISHHKRNVVADLPIPERLFRRSLDNTFLLHTASFIRGVMVVFEVVSDIPLALRLSSQKEAKTERVEDPPRKGVEEVHGQSESVGKGRDESRQRVEK